MDIQPNYVNLARLLFARIFVVPEFQRAYSWESKERKDLFEDLRTLHRHSDPDRHHFMATIVCLKTGQEEDVATLRYERLQVVDGQQRLTTLIILLKALSKALSASALQDERDVAEGITRLLVKMPGKLLLLQTNHDVRGILRRYLEEGSLPGTELVTTRADKNLREAIEDCEHFVINWDDGPMSLLRLVQNRLSFVLFVVDDNSIVYRIFEVLNSRGLPVESLDKCKSMLMGIAFDKLPQGAASGTITEIDNRWAHIYDIIGLSSKLNGDEILRFAATLHRQEVLHIVDPDLKEYKERIPSRPMSAEDAIGLFRSLSEADAGRVTDVTLWLLDIAQALKDLYTNKRIAAVTDIAHARLVAVAVKMRSDLSEQDRAEILNEWEKVTFRIFGLFHKDARTAVGDYTRLAHRIFNSDRRTKQEIVSELRSIGKAYPIKDAINGLKGADWYNRREEDLRYLLYRYEESLAAAAGTAWKPATNDQEKAKEEEIWVRIWEATPATTIEHIYPQQPGDGWHSLGRDEYNRYVNCLGNLILLPPGLNSMALNKTFAEKKAVYRQDEASLPRFVKNEILPLKEWNKRTIVERENRLLKWIEQAWG
jgi:hypothetical protein